MTSDMQAPPVTELGRARPRKEDARLVTGKTNWTDNIVLPGMLHVAFVRSPFAHARISRVDVSGALRVPGVVAAFSGTDFGEEQGSLPCAWPVTPDIVIPAHPPMASEEVRYVGEAVACVVARDRYTAADAVSAVDVDYEPLPPVLDIRTALDPSSPRVHEAGNKSFEFLMQNGDLDAAFRDAPVLIERTYRQQRLIPSAMEPRAVVGWNEGDEYTLWSATQIPHVLRVMLALTTGIPEHNIRVIAPDVGGGFGSKLQVTAEEVLALLISRKVGRPVKWTESRSEGNLTVHHGRDQWQRIKLAADSDGRIRGLDVDLLADMGAYLMLVTPGVPLLGAFMYNGIYKMDAYSFKCTGVFSTKMPTDAYRGAGRPEATFALERIMDELAAELKMDPLQVRERNWIKHEEFPYDTIAGLTYDSGNYEVATARARELFNYDGLRAEQRRRRDSNDPVQLGIGISTYTEMCGLAPSRVLGSLSYGAGGWEHASVRMLPTGKVEVVTGSSAHGQGHETAWSQIVADKLGVPFEDIRVLHGDTQVSPKGMDTYGSRSLTVGGIAVNGACEKVISKAKRISAHMLEASEDDIEFTRGRLHVRGDPESGHTIQEIALATFTAHALPDGVEPSLDSDATFDPENFSYPHGTHLCATEVDTETGQVTIRTYVAVDDVGKVVNPLIVDGQVHGGLAQGIAQALYEEAIYDDEGNMTTTTMADYLLPSAADLPHFTTDRTETPATTNPLGVKGVGEAGTIASTPAVVNAIVDALRPLGIQDITMPCTPERVWRAINAANGGAA
jgi:aerobic carbon-monoxide dehydrogenase large subunit